MSAVPFSLTDFRGGKSRGTAFRERDRGDCASGDLSGDRQDRIALWAGTVK